MASNLSSLIEISLSRLRIFSYSISESLSEDLKSFKTEYAKTADVFPCLLYTSDAADDC